MQVKFALKLAAATLVVSAASARPASANSASADYFRLRGESRNAPSVLTKEERDYYTALFSAERREDWTAVQTMLAQKTDGPLHAVAKAACSMRS